VEFWREYAKDTDFDMVLVDDAGRVYVTEGIQNVFTSDKTYEVIKR